MNARLVRRLAGLAAVALVGALGVIALGQIRDDGDPDVAPPQPAPVEWESATVGIDEPKSEPTACGVTVTAETLGIVHPVLPCGARLLLEHQGRRVGAAVVERGPVDAGRAFDLTPALAQQLGVAGEATVRWRFAE